MSRIIRLADVYCRNKTKEVKADSAYFTKLDEILDTLFEVANGKGMTWADLARESGLSYQTVVNIGERWTKRPQFRTVILIANALDMQIQIKSTANKKNVTLKVAS